MMSIDRVKLLLPFILLVLLRVPFFWTGHIQEDAFITWRVASNIAHDGTYGFNPGERVCATTSVAYTLLCSLAMLIFSGWFIPLMQIAATIATLAGVWLLVYSLFHELADRSESHTLAIMVACSPCALLISYSGMETAFLFLCVSAYDYCARFDRHPVIRLCILALGVWIRPDSVAIWAVYLAASWLASGKRPARDALLFSLSVVAYLAFNLLYFGEWLPHTIIAKRTAYALEPDPGTLIRRMLDVFVGQNVGGIYNPLPTKYLGALGLVFLALQVFSLAFYLSRRPAQDRLHLLSLPFLVIGLPAIYAFGGVLFPWYFWISATVGWTLTCYVLLEATRRAFGRFSLPVLSSVLALLILSRWLLSLNWGTQEMKYRASVGADLKRQVAAGSWILLEPAGYIPYFSGLRTWDEVGLVSPIVTEYMRRHGRGWYPRFVRDLRPDVLLTRENILETGRHSDRAFSRDDLSWLKANYRLHRRYAYSPGSYTTNRVLLRILVAGSACDYYVLRRSGSTPGERRSTS